MSGVDELRITANLGEPTIDELVGTILCCLHHPGTTQQFIAEKAITQLADLARGKEQLQKDLLASIALTNEAQANAKMALKVAEQAEAERDAGRRVIQAAKDYAAYDSKLFLTTRNTDEGDWFKSDMHLAHKQLVKALAAHKAVTEGEATNG